MMRAVWAGIMLALMLGAGCFDDEPELAAVCTHACQCSPGTPHQVEQCSDICVGLGEQVGLSPDCLECLSGASCRQLDDDACNAVCAGDEEPPEEEPLPEEPLPNSNISETTGGTQ